MDEDVIEKHSFDTLDFLASFFFSRKRRPPILFQNALFLRGPKNVVMIIISYHQISKSCFLESLRLTLGDMHTNQVPENYKNDPEQGPGGSVWAQTLSKRRPEAQDHFPSPPGPKNPT